MNEPLINSQSQAQAYLDKAETYKKLGLKAQVQYELEQAKRIDPYVTHEARYRTLFEEDASQALILQGLKTPMRIGSGMLIINAMLNVLFLILIFSSGDTSGIGGGDVISPIVDIVIAVNLWQLKAPWKRYTVWWAVLGLILFGLGSIAAGDFFGLIIQFGFSGALILLLAGSPSRVRTISAVAVFLVLYLAMICLVFTVSFLGII